MKKKWSVRYEMYQYECSHCGRATTNKHLICDCRFSKTSSEPQPSAPSDENPKKQWGDSKAPFWGVPQSALTWLGNVMGGGGYKYGLFNYRDTKIQASTYNDAILRHMALYMDGENDDPMDTGSGNAPGSGAPHLAHVMACAALLLDAQLNDMMIDDRSKTGKVREQLDHSAEVYARFKASYDAYINKEPTSESN